MLMHFSPPILLREDNIKETKLHLRKKKAQGD